MIDTKVIVSVLVALAAYNMIIQPMIDKAQGNYEDDDLI
jgi:hypothetical protein